MSLIRTASGFREAKVQLKEGRALLLRETQSIESSGGSKEHAARMLWALRARLGQLESAIQAYEAFASGDLSSLEGQPLGVALIAARIARGMSQAELARRTGLDAAQINRHEINEYRSAGQPHIELIRKTLELGARYHLEGANSAEESVSSNLQKVSTNGAALYRQSAKSGSDRRGG